MLNVVKNGGTAKEDVSCNVQLVNALYLALRFGAYQPMLQSIALTENDLTFVFWHSPCAPERAIVVLIGLQNTPNIDRVVRQKRS